jgi:hypothetical protein
MNDFILISILLLGTIWLNKEIIFSKSDENQE